MEKLNVVLKNCHGIREVDATFKFEDGNAVAVYAPNGTMKTSFARTFADFSTGTDTVDHMFPSRETRRSMTDESGDELEPTDVVVVPSYDEDLGPTESTSTLLVNPDLRKEYEDLQGELAEARDELVSALKTQSRTKQDVTSTLSRVFTQQEDNFFEALVLISDEVQQLEDTRFAELPHDVLFNEKVERMLRSSTVQEALAQYVTRLNELLDASTFFDRASFSFYNATNVTKSLGDNGFFAANHSLLLRGEDSSRPVTSQDELNALIAEERKRIADDDALRKKLDGVEKEIQKNVDTRKFLALISEREDILPELVDFARFQKSVWKAYIKKHEDLYQRAVARFKGTEVRRKEIEQQAAAENTHWEQVIEIFNDRFFVPFRLGVKNKSRVMLGEENVPRVVFQFKEGGESTGVERNKLLAVLSNGEKKALYILNILFEVEARRRSGRETLFVIDDLADSFDYKNKYSIIQYLKEMAEFEKFKMIILTHNFDFFRTLVSRNVVSYKRCFMAQKETEKVVLSQAKYINNPFIREFKKNFFDDGMQRVSSVPFMRNILEYTRGADGDDYVRLTSLLHWKQDSESITNGDLDAIFHRLFGGYVGKNWGLPDVPVIDLMMEQGELALRAPEGVNFENKIVLSIVTRICAERYMVAEMDDPYLAENISGNQTHRLFDAFKSRGHGTSEVRETLESVVLMTPENIHVNSFMYEPIIDMSDAALRGLYSKVKQL